MSNQVHTWKMLVDRPECEHCQYRAETSVAGCKCGSTIGPTEIERRLNIFEQLLNVIKEQAADEGIWFVPQLASEEYLQIQLRLLHAVIESDKNIIAAVEEGRLTLL